ncbi:SDR family NAD(P)-dependent oxidoreductase [Parasphingorhabdus sp.]|uniref:SDR family NAD(P)-dependent oxidoreductase n=1 Tax=Parasphingorhabdus sp. TaxID=2709688 RepID=UPI003D2D3FFC
MKKRAAIVTGTSGGIGSAIGKALMQEGWLVIGINRSDTDTDCCDHLVRYDLSRCENEQEFSQDCIGEIRRLVGDVPILALVNNSATQILSATDDILLDDWQKSLAVNLTAPLLLSRAMVSELRANRGIILNIGSVHAQATKKEFVTYATTKAALHGLTRAMAVDLGPEIRVVCLAPAAIGTPMLNAGFEGKEKEFSELEQCHALERIGSPEEVADAAVFLLSSKAAFFTGSTLYLDGGVLSKLHDPA